MAEQRHPWQAERFADQRIMSRTIESSEWPALCFERPGEYMLPDVTDALFESTAYFRVAVWQGDTVSLVDIVNGRRPRLAWLAPLRALLPIAPDYIAAEPQPSWCHVRRFALTPSGPVLAAYDTDVSARAMWKSLRGVLAVPLGDELPPQKNLPQSPVGRVVIEFPNHAPTTEPLPLDTSVARLDWRSASLSTGLRPDEV